MSSRTSPTRESEVARAKLDVERYWLRYTLVWGALTAIVMLTGWATVWTDRELLPYGIVLGLGAVLPPALFPKSAEERARPILERTATRLGLTVVGFSFLMNYFTTPYFFDVLHMHFGFKSTIVIRDNPIFLYFLTVAYFATYASLLLLTLRFSRKLAARLPKAIAWVPVALGPFVVAGLETALNANPFMTKLFCYDDRALALGFGTLSYGACFCFTLPVWASVDEKKDVRPPGRLIAAWVLAAMVGMVLTFAGLRRFVAPHFTHVEDNAQGLGYVEGSCLER